MKNLSFEKALEELEKIVERLEGEELTLEESLRLFEEGVKLARFLREELEKAEKKVEILLKDEEGGLKPQPFDVAKRHEVSESKEEVTGEEDEDLPF
ncbi:MAG: exodeoxyribonuclease VII small subunit [Candidatus Aminicenantes bacterium]|nr:exodeoxyribonuclease VII small subunit [Candidatus Aminicenantes bacterium]RLE03662.1 MAG: exodeoxyribonuclease VII small subunit [Candidatus Aminicenantes bacterium]RLE04203.1 MAG: exodeoxyribonuclease VII small subunit [Candidatus Aminicenantes bacterium]HHF42273.1 exodeoxyribonuclease VII small subunit [Candidatus Aminicenantes bacterium]